MDHEQLEGVCILCGKPLSQSPSVAAGAGWAHNDCLIEFREDQDEQYVADCCRQYGVPTVTQWVRAFAAGARGENN